MPSEGVPPRRLFIAGANGAVGRTVTRLGGEAGDPLVPHFRPGTAARLGDALPAGAVVFSLEDRDSLHRTLLGCTTVLQLIGTMRKRFSSGDTWQSSDIDTTRFLVEASRTVGTVDHFILLSSIGAGRPVGGYLQAKAAAETLVRQSGIPFTIFRPSAFDGEGHRAPPGMSWLRHLPGLRDYAPISVTVLAASLLACARARGPLGEAMEGRDILEGMG